MSALEHINPPDARGVRARLSPLRTAWISERDTGPGGVAAAFIALTFLGGILGAAVGTSTGAALLGWSIALWGMGIIPGLVSLGEVPEPVSCEAAGSAKRVRSAASALGELRKISGKQSVSTQRARRAVRELTTLWSETREAETSLEARECGLGRISQVLWAEGQPVSEARLVERGRRWSVGSAQLASEIHLAELGLTREGLARLVEERDELAGEIEAAHRRMDEIASSVERLLTLERARAVVAARLPPVGALSSPRALAERRSEAGSELDSYLAGYEELTSGSAKSSG